MKDTKTINVTRGFYMEVAKMETSIRSLVYRGILESMGIIRPNIISVSTKSHSFDPIFQVEITYHCQN